MELKVTDKVKYQVKWPPTQLQAHFVKQGYKFNELTQKKPWHSSPDLSLPSLRLYHI